MNSTNYGFRANTNDDDLKVNLNKSEKFQDAVNDMRLTMWKRFLSGVVSNPHMTKKETCHHLGLKVGTINSVQQYYKLSSPFYYSKPNMRRKQVRKESEIKEQSIDTQAKSNDSSSTLLAKCASSNAHQAREQVKEKRKKRR